MNVGLRRAAAGSGGQTQRDARRPRSPEGKAGGARAQSPVLKQERGARAPPAGPPPVSTAPAPGPPQLANKRGTSSTVEEIKRIDQNREHRRRAAEEMRRSRQDEAAMLGAQCGGAVPDIDFHRMIRDFRQHCPPAQHLEPVSPMDPDRIAVCVRKRPIQQHEVVQRELDCVTACNPFAIIHERKFKVDGITKCLESHQFQFDRVFDEDVSTEDVFKTVAEPLVPWTIERGGRATIFAYGQTGSGKTHTMTGLQRLLAEQLFDHIRRRSEPLEVSMSFFEIYGGRPYDLLNSRQRLDTLEDAKNEVQIAGLTERAVGSAEAMLQLIELGNSLRTTHATAINRDSSRSHAICAVFIRPAGSAGAAALVAGGSAGIHAKITLVDLAGSERAADSKSTIRQRRVEGAQINKSLLALKECIRAMGDPREGHVPFRASKLTLVLRDAFVTRCPSRTLMIACISPGMTSADHSVNTLRYSDRLKDHPRASREHRPTEDEGERERHRAPSMTGAHKSESPGPGLRRSPSPGLEAPAPGGRLSRPRATSAAALEVQREEHADGLLSDDEELEETPCTPTPAWEEPGPARVCLVDPPPAPACAAAPAAGSRQHVSRRGRQPTLRPRDAGAPTRPDALGSRGHGHAAHAADAGRHHHPTGLSEARACELAAVAGHDQLHAHDPRVPVLSQTQPQHVQTSLAQGDQLKPESATVRLGGAFASSTAASSRMPRCNVRRVDPSPERAPAVRPSDLHQQDNTYLHNTLTSEVFERSGGAGAGGVVDVGVENLTDLEHLEVADEVCQLGDRIVSQHMVVLQEDARLLTEESELLSQVQQGASYDIDWYVHAVDRVVRRKMDVYAGFLADLEVFKAQLRREESLSRNCQRGRGSGAWAPAAEPQDHGPGRPELQPAPHAAPHASPREDPEGPDQLQRLPRTPRVPQAREGYEGREGERGELSAHAAALAEANLVLQQEASEAHRRVVALQEEARATAAAKDAHIASLEERIEATSQALDGVAPERSWQAGGINAVQRVWRCPSLPF